MNGAFQDDYRAILEGARFDGDEDLLLYGPPAAYLRAVGDHAAWRRLLRSLGKAGARRLASLARGACREADDFLGTMDAEDVALGLWKVQLANLFTKALFASRKLPVPRELAALLLWLEDRCASLPLDRENREAVLRCRHESGLADGDLVAPLLRAAASGAPRAAQPALRIPLGKARRQMKDAALDAPPEELGAYDVRDHLLDTPHGVLQVSLFLDDRWGVNVSIQSGRPLPRRMYWGERLALAPSRETNRQVDFRVDFEDRNPFRYADFLRRDPIVLAWDDGRRLPIRLG